MLLSAERGSAALEASQLLLYHAHSASTVTCRISAGMHGMDRNGNPPAGSQPEEIRPTTRVDESMHSKWQTDAT
eukprot:347647-Chlamydomonas_euryale.AAC.3